MKNIIMLITTAAFAAVVISCNKPKDPRADHVMPAGQISGASLYQSHDLFTDQNAKTMMLHELSGKYVVVAMFYATCTAICPRIAAEKPRLEKSLSSSQREKTRFVTISFDHERDNPAVLRKFIEKMRLTDSFTLLTGKPNAIREASAALGISYKKLDASTGLSKRETEDGRSTGNYEYSHSSLFTLLSPQGEISMQHAFLFELANRVVSGIRVPHTKEDMEPIIKELEDYAEKRFHYEESVIESAGYEHTAEHKEQHQKMRVRLQALHKLLGDNALTPSELYSAI